MFKPKYAPELHELISQKDGSINEEPHNILESKREFAEKYRQRQVDFESKMNQPLKSKNTHERRVRQQVVGSKPKSNTFGGIINEMKSIYEDVKKELEK